MDNLNELGKELKSIRGMSDDALGKYVPAIPVTERIRDVFDAVRSFSMKFKTSDEQTKVTLDLFFENATFSGSQDTCTDCYCVNIDQFTGGADGNTYTLDYIPIADTVRVYFGDYALQPGEKGFTVLGQNVLINIPSVGYVITVIYLYYIRFNADGSPACTGGEDADGNPCTYSIDEFDNRIVPAGSTSLGESSSLANWGEIVIESDPVTGTKKWMISKDTLIAKSDTGSNLGGGADPHLIVGGPYDGYRFRSLLYHATNWDEVVKIVSAYLHIKNAGQIHITYTGDPRVFTQRLTASFTENSGKGSADGGSGWNGDPTDYAFTSWSTVGQGPVKDLAPGEGSWNNIDVTPFIEEIAPATVKRRNGNPGGAKANYGFVLREHNEYDGQRIEFYSSEHSDPDKRPHIDFTYLKQDIAPGYAMVDNGIGTVYSPTTAYTGQLTFDEIPNVAWPLILYVKFKFNMDKSVLDTSGLSEDNGATFTFRGQAYPVGAPEILYDVIYQAIVGWRVTTDWRYPGQYLPQAYIKFRNDEEEPSLLSPVDAYSSLSSISDNMVSGTWLECKLYIDPIGQGRMMGKVWVSGTAEPSSWKIGPTIKTYPVDTPQLPLPKGVSGSYFMKTPTNITSDRVLDIEFIRLLCSYPVIAGSRIIDNFGRNTIDNWGTTETPVITWEHTSTGTGPHIYGVQDASRMFVEDGGGTAQSVIQFTHGQSFVTLHRFKISSSVSNPATAGWKADFKMGTGTYERYWGIGGNTLAGANIRLYMGWQGPLDNSNYNDWIEYPFLLNNWYWAEWQCFEGIEQRLKIWLDSGTKPDSWNLINNLSATVILRLGAVINPASPMTSYGYTIIASAPTVGVGNIDLNIDDLNIDYETS